MCYNTDSVLTSSQKHVCDTEMNRTRKSWKKINSKKNKNKKQLTEKIQSKAQYMKAILRTTSSLWWKGFVEKARLDALCRDVHGVKNTSPAQQAKAQPGLAQTETNHSPALPGPTQPNLACLSPICKNNDVTLLSCAVGAGQFHNWKSITRFYSCTVDLHYTTSLIDAGQYKSEFVIFIQCKYDHVKCQHTFSHGVGRLSAAQAGPSRSTAFI